MNLWTEYEGVTIDSAFALTKLVQTEGRSAFFSTRNANGESVLIRIIECHFDEDEIRARWRGVQTLGHPNFLRIDRFGQFHVQPEDTVAAYAVFERVEANLGEVLERGRLSAADASQIGLSVCSALETLHASGFVHQHVEPRNIYSVGDKVKLRSDCIRETPEGEAGIEARRRDVHDLAALLMQVLLGASPGSRVPSQAMLTAPFDEIVRNGMNGSWGLAEIKETLVRRDAPKGPPKRITSPEPALMAAVPPVIQAPLAKTSDFSVKPSTFDKGPKFDFEREPSATPAPGAAAHAGPAIHADLAGHKPEPMELPVIFGISEHDFRKWRNAAVLLVSIVFVGWMLVHWFSHPASSSTQPSSPDPTANSAPDTAIAQNTDSLRASAAPAVASRFAAPAANAGLQSRVQWRVVAFTYNRQDQAQKKVSTLAEQHPDLSPTIFSPTGRAPWLVTIGGSLQRDAAYALARKARSLGLPRDTYAQNYTMR